jgi:PAS domain S-box-containing protein
VGQSCRIMGWHRGTACTICPTRRCFKSGQIERGVIEVAEALDHYKSYQIISTPVFDTARKVKKVLELVQDVTDLRKLERKVDEQQVFLTAIANDAADAIIGLTVDDTVISWNKGAEKLFGYHSDEIIGQKFSVVIPELYTNEGWSNTKATLKEQGYVRNYETTCCTKKRKESLVEVTQSLITDDEGNFIGTSLVVRDITDRKREEQKTIQTERMALVGQMAAKVAHEMRNPLSSISLNTELLEDEILSFGSKNTGESTELIRSIAIEVDRLAHLSDEYLNFSRLPAFKFSHCNINTVITDLVTFQRKDLSRKNIEIITKLKRNLSYVRIDKEQMRRAMLNLLRNAAEAMPDGGTIRVQTAQTDGSIKIAVKDAGIGIAQDDMTNIFNPFFSTKSIGTGLGLTITRQIVEEHGGTVTCLSQLDQGTTFTILLPLHNRMNEAAE